MDLISVLVAMSMMLLSVIIVKMLDNTPIRVIVSTSTENYYDDDSSDGDSVELESEDEMVEFPNPVLATAPIPVNQHEE
jgi:hypothetical protein